ncbi:GlsB/YeaQ/YmgE family stress response membrane protein [Paenibacillus barcinonensis]|nr:GlsB/YeaQ/YmgE family stress response membrane protein [Paenibacillus barcinonensis]
MTQCLYYNNALSKKHRLPGSSCSFVIGNIVAGFIGSWLGTELLGARGPVVGGFHIIPAIVGAIIALLIFFALARGGAFRRR